MLVRACAHTALLRGAISPTDTFASCNVEARVGCATVCAPAPGCDAVCGHIYPVQVKCEGIRISIFDVGVFALRHAPAPLGNYAEPTLLSLTVRAGVDENRGGVAVLLRGAISSTDTFASCNVEALGFSNKNVGLIPEVTDQRPQSLCPARTRRGRPI